MSGRKGIVMNKNLPLSPIEKDALMYLIISVLILISVNQLFAKAPLLDSSNAGYNYMSCLPFETNQRSMPFEIDKANASSGALTAEIKQLRNFDLVRDFVGASYDFVFFVDNDDSANIILSYTENACLIDEAVCSMNACGCISFSLKDNFPYSFPITCV
jgi:hypothetical protein